MTLVTNRKTIAESKRGDGADDLGLLALINAMWRGKFWILLCATIGLALGWYEATKVVVPLYTSTAQMALQIRNPQVVDFQSVISGVSGEEKSMNTEMEIIRSTALVSLLVDELGLMNDPEFNPTLAQPRPISILEAPQAALRWLLGFVEGTETSGNVSAESDLDELRRIVVGSVRETITPRLGDRSYIFTISVTTGNKDKSALMANALANIYGDDQIRIKIDATENAAIWLSERVSDLAIELEQRQSDVAALRSTNALVSAEGLQAVNAQAIELRQRLQVVQLQEARSVERLEAIRTAPVGDTAAQAVAANDTQLDAIAAAVESGDATAQQRFERRYEQVAAQAEAEGQRASQQVRELQLALESLSGQFEQQSADLLQLQQLERETEATRILYETFLTRLKETSVLQGVHQAESRILSGAEPGEQVAPRRMVIMSSSMFLGLLFGAGIVILREVMQNTYRNANDLERRTGLVVLGQVPRVPRRKRLDVVAYLLAKPTSAAAEAIRNMRTSILLSNVDAPPKVIMMTSSVPGEGKTLQSIALAQNLAGLDKKVLLVEGDIRRRTFGVYFPSAKEVGGLLSVISGKVPLRDAAFRAKDLGIDVLIGEKSSVNAADVFSSERFRHLIDEMRQIYDYVIIDTPPVLVVPDARVIGQSVDAVVYVVRWDDTSRSQVEEGLKQFQSASVPVTGLVLTQIDPTGMRRYGYGGKYGAYSAYGKRYYEN